MPTTPADTAKYTDGRLNCFLNRLLETLEQSVFPQLDLQLYHNTKYDQPALLDLLTHISLTGEFANTGAKTRQIAVGEPTTLRSDRRSPLAKALGYQLRQLPRGSIETQFAHVFEEIRTLAKRGRLLSGPVDVAIDVHDWLFYGDEETEMVANTNPSQGTATAYKFVTACVVTAGLRLTVAVEPLATKKALPEALGAVIEQARDWVEIRRIFLDRGFYRVACLQVLHDQGIPYVMRAPRFQSLDDGEPTVQVEDDYRMTQSYPPYDWVKTTRFTVPHAQSPDEKQTYFVTNCQVTKEQAPNLAESYRRRWGIETSYRVIGDFLPKSRSTDYSVRLFYFLFAVTLYNLWVLVNRLLTVVFEPTGGTPLVSAAVFGQLIRQRWWSDRPKPG